MYPEEPLKYPSCGRALGRIPFLVGERQALGLETFPDAPFERGVDHQTQRQNPKRGHDSPLALQIKRVGKELGVFEIAKPPLDLNLAFVMRIKG